MVALIVTVVIGLAKWLIYTGLLWVMIKLQKLNYHLLGLFASSLLATALGYIPFIGTYIGWAALVLCLWKCTGADIAPDVLFTVGIAGALMFCVNLFAIGWMMGNLHLVPALAEGEDRDAASQFQVDFADHSKSWSFGQATNAASAAAGNPAVKTVSPSALAGLLTLKGVSLNGKEHSALVAQGRHIHDIRIGEAFTVTAGEKLVKLTCDDITPSAVVFKTEDAQRVRLTFQ